MFCIKLEHFSPLGYVAIDIAMCQPMVIMFNNSTCILVSLMSFYHGMLRRKELKLYGPNMLASYAAAALTKECNKRAFSKHRRAMVASDMIAEIGPAFEHLFVRDTAGSGEFV